MGIGSGIKPRLPTAAPEIPKAPQNEALLPRVQRELDKHTRTSAPKVLVPPEQAPALYASIQRVLDDHVKALKQAYHDAPPPKLFIADTPEVNAGMLTTSDGAFLLITTGWIKAFLNPNVPADEVGKQFALMTASIPHELGHALGHGSNPLGELHADRVNQVVTENAGYPSHLFHDAFNALTTAPQSSSAGRRAMIAFAQTHPPTPMRQSVQRLEMTLARVERGASGALPDWLHSIPHEQMLRELDGITAFREQHGFVWPQSLDETVDRLTQALHRHRDREGDTFHLEREVQRLTVVLDSFIERAGPNLTAEQEQRLVELFREWSELGQYDQPVLAQPRRHADLGFTDLFGEEAFLSSGKPETPYRHLGHDRQLRALPFYRERAPALVRELLASKSGDRDGIVNELRRAGASLMLSPATLMDHFGDELVKVANQKGPLLEWAEKPRGQSSFNGSLQRLTPAAERGTRQDDSLQLMSELAMRSFVARGEPATELPHLFGFVHESGVAQQWKREAAQGRAAAAENLQTFERLAKKTWEHRGTLALSALAEMGQLRIGTSEVLPLGENFSHDIDLRALARLVGVPDQAVSSNIRNEVRKVLLGEKTGEAKEVADAFRARFETNVWQRKSIETEGLPVRDNPRAFWLDRSLLELIRQKLPSQYSTLALAHYPDALQAASRRDFRAMLSGSSDAKTLIDRITASEWMGYKLSGPSFATAVVIPLMEEIAGSGLSQSTKRKLFEHFLGPSAKLDLPPELHEFSEWKRIGTPDEVDRLFTLLVESGAAGDAIEYLQAHRGMAKIPPARLAPQLLRQLQSNPTFENALRYVSLFEAQSLHTFNSRELRPLGDEILRIARGSQLTQERRQSLHSAMAADTGSPELDRYFKELVLPDFSGGVQAKEALLKGGKIHSEALQIELARDVLEGEARAVAAFAEKGPDAVPEDQLREFFSELDELSPNASSAKDKLLNQYAYAFDLRGELLRELVESKSVRNFGELRERDVRSAGAMFEYFSQLSARDRIATIQFLSDPGSREVPDAVRRPMLDFAAARQRRLYGQSNPKTASEEAQLIEDELTRRLAGKSHFERIALYEPLIASGTGALLSRQESLARFYDEVLGIEPGSVDETYLRAYLDTAPEHERSVTLAYLVARRAESAGESAAPGAAIRGMFEAFGTPGKKAGQLAEILNLFGPEASAALKELKSHAVPMSKAEIEAQLDLLLTPDQRAQIKRVRGVLGAASLKTVAEVELVDGRHAALLVQPGNVQKLTESNLRLMTAYADALKAEKRTHLPSAMMDNLLLSLKETLSEEQQFRVEAGRMHRADGVVQHLNRELKDVLNGWSFEVPKPIPGFPEHDGLLLVELAQKKGVTGRPEAALEWEELSQAQQDALGPILAESQLKSLFHHGEMEPDRHVGNWRFDPESKTIYLLDVGQLEAFERKASRFKSDDVLTLARTIQGIKEGNGKLLTQMGLEMRRPESRVTDVKGMERTLSAVLASDKPFSDKMIDVISVWAEHGIYLQKKFFFGGLKGLLVLNREGYADPKQFEQLVEKYVRQTITHKLPVAIGQELRQRLPFAFREG